MDHHLPETPVYISKVRLIKQAIFYCYNASSDKIPVGIFHDFDIEDDQTLFFKTSYFPVIEMFWHSFAAELHFYSKQQKDYCLLHGVATMDKAGAIRFKIEQAVYGNERFGYSENSLGGTRPLSWINFYKKSIELIMHPSRRKAPTGVFQ